MDASTASSTAQPLTRQQIEAKIAKRCLEDETFRAEFIADPKACFTKYLGIPSGNLPTIVVHEEAAGSWSIVVPPKLDPSRELTDEELEQVAGGVSTVVVSIATLSIASMLGTAATAGAASAVGSAGVSATVAIGTSNDW